MVVSGTTHENPKRWLSHVSTIFQFLPLKLKHLSQMSNLFQNVEKGNADVSLTPQREREREENAWIENAHAHKLDMHGMGFPFC